MSNLLPIYYTFVLEVHVELDILLNNLDDMNCVFFFCGVIEDFLLLGCVASSAAVSRRFGGMCRLFLQGFKSHGE